MISAFKDPPDRFLLIFMSIVFHNATLPLVRQGSATLTASNKTMIFRPLLAYCSFNKISNRGASGVSSPIDTEENSRKDIGVFIRRSDRPALRPSLYHLDRPNDSRINRKSRLCPTRDMNFTPEMWAHHKAPGRHLRHLVSVFGCASFQRLVFPDLFLTATVAAGLTYYNVAFGGAEPFYFDATCFASCSTAISVLAGFRLNASYDRFNEARRIMGVVNNTSRDLMGQSCMFLNNKNRHRVKKLTKSFFVALHFHLNTKGGHFKLDSSAPETKGKVNDAYRAEMREIFFPPAKHFYDDAANSNEHADADADFEIICEAYESGSHVPLLILSFIRKTIIENKPPINPVYGVDMDGQVSNLTTCLGSCERLLRTPIVTTFTSNTSRLMSLWSLSLPFALFPLTGPHWTLPFSVLLSYVVLSIEDVGVEIEEPFHVLPLRQYTEGCADSLDAIVKAYEVCPRGVPSRDR